MKKLLFVLTLATMLISQQASAQMYVKVLQANDTVPVKGTIPVKFEGKVQECYEYKDAAGLHLFLATATGEGKNFFGTAYTLVNGIYVQDWQIKDYSSDEVGMADDYTKIVDIDKDGVYETIIVYQYPTENDKYNGTTWKMLLHYKNKKYAIRGHQKDSDYDEPEVTMDKSFDTLPKSVKDYVMHYWNKLAKDQGAMALFDIKK
jgi:hypothetical protein